MDIAVRSLIDLENDYAATTSYIESRKQNIEIADNIALQVRNAKKRLHSELTDLRSGKTSRYAEEEFQQTQLIRDQKDIIQKQQEDALSLRNELEREKQIRSEILKEQEKREYEKLQREHQARQSPPPQSQPPTTRTPPQYLPPSQLPPSRSQQYNVREKRSPFLERVTSGFRRGCVLVNRAEQKKRKDEASFS